MIECLEDLPFRRTLNIFFKGSLSFRCRTSDYEYNISFRNIVVQLLV
jgi:hypothetical protein